MNPVNLNHRYPLTIFAAIILEILKIRKVIILNSPLSWPVLVNLLYFFVTLALRRFLCFPESKYNICVVMRTKNPQATWTFCFPARTIFSRWAIAVFTTMLRGRKVTISLSKLHTSTTRCTTSRIIRPFSKSTIYRTWFDKTSTCFSPVPNAICATICWSWVVTFSCMSLNSTTTWFGTLGIFRPYSKLSINWYLDKKKVK